jgi:hypothetical protein
MARRSYGTGSLYARTDARGREQALSAPSSMTRWERESPAHRVDEEPNARPVQGLGGEQGVDGPRVAVSGGGTATFTWTQGDYGLNTAWAITRFPAGNLGPAEKVKFLYDPEDLPPELGVDRNGNAVIAWERDGTSCDPNPDCEPLHDVSAVVRSPSGTFGPYETLSTTGKHPDVAVNASGQAVVAWVEPGGSYPDHPSVGRSVRQPVVAPEPSKPPGYGCRRLHRSAKAR